LEIWHRLRVFLHMTKVAGVSKDDRCQCKRNL